MRRKKTESQKLAAKMAASFEEIAGRRLDDPTAKRFFVAFMLALPTLEGVDMNTMVSTLERHLGFRKVKDTFEALS